MILTVGGAKNKNIQTTPSSERLPEQRYRQNTLGSKIL